MSNNELYEALRLISEGVVLAEVADLPALARLHDEFTHIAGGIEAMNQPALTAAARAGAAALERIILREEADPAATLAKIGQTVAALQAVVVDERPLSEVHFPFDDGAPSPQNAATTSDSASAPTQSAEASGSGDTTQTAPQAATEQPVNAPTAAAPAPPAAAPAQPLVMSGDADLISEFVMESTEHLDGVDVHLLTIENNASDAEALNAVFRAFHTIKGVAGFLELTPIQELAHETETLLDKCRKGEMALANGALDVVFEATDVMKALVAAVGQALGGDRVLHPHEAVPGLLPRIRAAVRGEQVAKAPSAPKPQATAEAATPAPQTARTTQTNAAANENVAKTTSNAGETTSKTAPPAQTPGATPAAAGSAAVKETVRVDAERLDKLVDAIGELVIAEAMVSQAIDSNFSGSSPVGRMLTHLDKITRELQELAMSLRMVPVRTAFQRMARLARDVSKKLSKPVDFVTNGEDTELDKNVVDAIGDPLVHMVRNAVDHGIEDDVEERRRAGKPDEGRVELRAFHQGGSIYIEIEDDGRGLDREKLLAKARERGLVKDGDAMTDSEVFNLIFEPGFSTAKKVTDVSGRGVGLDVVKRNIQALRGKTEIRSVVGKGTVFSIRLPLTLAIIEGMVLRLGGQRFIVPTLSIVRMVRPGEEDISTVFERDEMLKLGDRLVPLHRLDQIFDIDGAVSDPCQAAVVVVEHDNRQVAFLVDELLGQQQIVIKPLGSMLRKAAGFSGGAIMPDGRVGLILDVAGLATMAGREDTFRRAA